MDGRRRSKSRRCEPIRNPDEMGLPGDLAAQKLRAIPPYDQDVRARVPEVRGHDEEHRDGPRRVRAHAGRAECSRSTATTPATQSALDEAAVRGKELFFGRARCATCHSGPNFTDGLFHNTGVIGDDLGRAAFDRVGEFQMRPYPFFQMRRAFKTPGLRNVALTAPYQHDGSEASLAEVVRFYNLGGRDPRSYGKALDIRPLHLTDAELDDLVAFLEALTSPGTVPQG